MLLSSFSSAVAEINELSSHIAGVQQLGFESDLRLCCISSPSLSLSPYFPVHLHCSTIHAKMPKKIKQNKKDLWVEVVFKGAKGGTLHLLLKEEQEG